MKIQWQQPERSIELDIEIQPDGIVSSGALNPYKRIEFREKFLPVAPNKVWRDAYIIYLVQFALIHQRTDILDRLWDDWQFTRTSEGFELEWNRKQKPKNGKPATRGTSKSRSKPARVRETLPKATRSRIWVRFVQGGAPGLGKRA